MSVVTMLANTFMYICECSICWDSLQVLGVDPPAKMINPSLVKLDFEDNIPWLNQAGLRSFTIGTNHDGNKDLLVIPDLPKPRGFLLQAVARKDLPERRGDYSNIGNTTKVLRFHSNLSV
mmetsp:Transcript_14987/g.28351  ORF Transcript_14987/g.28351 Transcript_14987/m.28351 type:complete len:120 (-) Transcript_14987:1052-1411(-)